VESNKHGTIWIKDGQLFVKDPEEGGNSPTVTPCAGVELLINNERVESKTALTEQDTVRLTPNVNVESVGGYNLYISDGGLSATLALEPGIIHRDILQDAEPTENLTLVTVKETKAYSPLSHETLMQEIDKKGITFGIKDEIITALLETPQEGNFIIAEGIPPGETIDDVVEIIAKKKSTDEVDDRNRKIDFREMDEILSVDEGALLAIRRPGVQGENGTKVTGMTVPAAKQLILSLLPGKGTEISEDGLRIVATVSGSPVFKKSGNKYIVDVQPILYQRGDVDLASGNIHFKGDVVIQGSVTEGMAVMASGTVTIHGMVHQATINATKGMNIKQNITGSSLLSGGDTAIFNSFFSLLDPIQKDLAEIITVLPSLANHPKLQGVKTGHLVQVLIDKKYARLPNLVNELIKFSAGKSFRLPPEISDLTEHIDMYIRGLNILKIESPTQLEAIIDEINVTHNIIESIAKNKASVSFPYAVNSKIESSGDVTVAGNGCINTSIHAAGNVNIQGVFRGGEIFARGDVTINEAGSELGAKTLIRTGERRKVVINKANEGVRIQIGDRQVTFPSTQFNIRAEMAKDGNIRVGANKQIAK